MKIASIVKSQKLKRVPVCTPDMTVFQAAVEIAALKVNALAVMEDECLFGIITEQDIILCLDGSWLCYRAQCHKQDSKVWDIFVAKASDGRWYYSDYHFCVGMMVLSSWGQPTSLEQFKRRYALEEFDGVSDLALEPTKKP